MYYASVNFARKSAFIRAVRGGLSVIAFNPAFAIPAINGEVTIVGPWALEKYASRDPQFMTAKCKHGWQARCRVQDMRVTEVH